MIDEEETFKRFGYYSMNLTPNSDKKIVAVCDDCEKIRILPKHGYKCFCKSCVRKTKNNPSPRKKHTKETKEKISKITKGLKRSEKTKQKMRGANNHNWRGGPIERKCKTCGVAFFVSRSCIDVGAGKFCSRKCFGLSERKEKTEEWRKGLTKIKCRKCGTVFYEYMSASKRRNGEGIFCSTKCKGLSIRGANHPNWEGGSSFGKYCPKFNEELREHIRDKFDRKCFLCNKTENENKRKLSVHHVNYDKQCMCNDTSCQLVPLCIKCHSKTNTNREYWYNIIMTKLAQRIDGYYI